MKLLKKLLYVFAIFDLINVSAHVLNCFRPFFGEGIDNFIYILQLSISLGIYFAIKMQKDYRFTSLNWFMKIYIFALAIETILSMFHGTIYSYDFYKYFVICIFIELVIGSLFWRKLLISCHDAYYCIISEQTLNFRLLGLGFFNSLLLLALAFIKHYKGNAIIFVPFFAYLLRQLYVLFIIKTSITEFDEVKEDAKTVFEEKKISISRLLLFSFLFAFTFFSCLIFRFGKASGGVKIQYSKGDVISEVHSSTNFQDVGDQVYVYSVDNRMPVDSFFYERKYGILDLKNNKDTGAIYDEAPRFDSNGIAWDYNSHFIDYHGNTVITVESNITINNSYRQRIINGYVKDHFPGYYHYAYDLIGETGPAINREIDNYFKNDYCPFYSEAYGAWGLVNNNGKVLIEPNYKIPDRLYGNDVIIFNNISDDKYYLIDEQANKCELDFEVNERDYIREIESFSELNTLAISIRGRKDLYDYVYLFDCHGNSLGDKAGYWSADRSPLLAGDILSLMKESTGEYVAIGENGNEIFSSDLYDGGYYALADAEGNINMIIASTSSDNKSYLLNMDGSKVLEESIDDIEVEINEITKEKYYLVTVSEDKKLVVLLDGTIIDAEDYLTNEDNEDIEIDLSAMGQMQIIYDNKNLWYKGNPEDEEVSDNYKYAVCDLDNDGLLEVINAVTKEESYKSENQFFEVTKDGSLTELDNSDMYCLSIDPDLKYNRTGIVLYKNSSNQYALLAPDYVKHAKKDTEIFSYKIYLVNNKVVCQKLGSERILVEGDTVQHIYTDFVGNILESRADYESMINKNFTGYEITENNIVFDEPAFYHSFGAFFGAGPYDYHDLSVK
ncbi:hypothetical protein SAMN04487829_0640 [Pseudobutyrivibrio sp. NOR37]|uniref:WG repeat-containing protein n=1 Tax=Pseudobutyrivibrio xylanivorans TaxID=185007 RepID=A0A6M0LEL0_PSEXY|nr:MULTISPECIES: WG repeat-containing protein [Pseudobutyrivibrio]NEX01058.1 hypothetical protein [Pseudobutyrivibrio xylanivorans]SFR64728.1 hypothetical protein SAMN04487829_0640 [Pseudobutyrivibrio sp. NOR37]